MNIAFIGAGNVSWHLAQAFENAGHYVTEVYSRDAQNAKKLVATLYDSAVQPDLNFDESAANLIVLSVSDDALESVIERVVFPPKAMVVNTSGMQSLARLRQLTEIYSDVPVRVGVFYPLQTFTKEKKMDLSTVPFCIEAADEEMEEVLIKLAQTISESVYRIDSEERRYLHVAATFANNFTNHMLTIAYELLDQQNIDFDILKPLINQTIQKALTLDNPADGQTGVARRGDWEMIGKHTELLQEINPEWLKLYRVMTESIRDKFHS